MIPIKFDKKQVNFEHPSMGEDKCGGCKWFLGGRCSIVAGKIEATDWCDHYTEKVDMNDSTTLHGMQTSEHDTVRSRTTGRLHEISFGPQPSGFVPANPFASLAQAGYMHSHPEKLGKAKLAEFDAATKGKKLPYKVKKSGKQ
jgi:hypothetical protein